MKTNEFHDILSKTTSQEADRIVDTLEKRLSELKATVTVLYSLEEIEALVDRQGQCGNLTAEYIALTDKYLTDAKIRNRVHRPLQISKNKNIKTTIVRAETKAGTRISQFGGLICLTRSN